VIGLRGGLRQGKEEKGPYEYAEGVTGGIVECVRLEGGEAEGLSTGRG